MKKQLCMETMSPGESLTFFVVRLRDELKYKMVSGVLPRFLKNRFNGPNEKFRSYNLGQGEIYAE